MDKTKQLWKCPECDRLRDRTTFISPREWLRLAKDPANPPKCRQHMKVMRLSAV